MSGGHFQYKQWEIGNIADEVEQLIIDNDYYSQETIEEFKKALVTLRQAHIYAQRIDWLVSGDDGEDSFHRRLKQDMEKLND